MPESWSKRIKRIDKQLKKRQYERDTEGRTIVNMTVKDDSNFLSVFAPSTTPIISTEVTDFIETNTISILSNMQLKLRIHRNCIDAQEKEIYRNAIKEYYTEKYLANERELTRNHWIVLLLTLAGISILVLAILLEYRMDSVIWSEVTDIAAWVFLWEAVDISVFKDRSLRLRRMRFLNYISMPIEYYPLHETELSNNHTSVVL